MKISTACSQRLKDLAMIYFAALVLFIIVTTINGKEIHITQHGNDSKYCGNITSPCLTLKKALQRATWNDVILITAFRNSQDSITSSDFCLNDYFGNVIDKSLTIRGISGTPIIDCKNRDDTALFIVTGTKKRLVTFVIENLQIQNVSVSAVSVADGIFVIRNCIFSKMLDAFMLQSGLISTSNLSLEVQNSSFIDCITAIQLSSSKLSINITGSKFIGNKRFKTNVGLAVPHSQSSFPKAKEEMRISVTRCTFQWNRFSISLQELARNTSVSISESRFEENSARGLHGMLDKGAVLYVLYAVFSDEHINIVIKDSFIKSNEANIGGAFHVDIFKSDPSYDDSHNKVRLLFDNVTMVNNTAQQVGGATFLSLSITDSKIKFRSCRVLSNRVDATDKVGRLSSLFFPALTGTGGGIYIAKGEALIDWCIINDNTATIFGGGIAATTKMVIQNSVINGSETNKNAKVSGRLVYLGGDVSIANVTMNARLPSEGVSDVWYQSTDKDKDISVKNFQFNCMDGASVKSVKIKSYVNEDNYYVFGYHCKQCESGTYSLQAGKEILYSSNTINTTNPTCISCPYGASCYDQIRAKPNYWGFKESGQLRFKMCPRGYCSQGINYTQINHCINGRRGTLCGRCVENSSDNLFNTNCSADVECNDWWIHIVVFILALSYVWFFLYLNDILRIMFRFIWPSHEHNGERRLKVPFITKAANNSTDNTMEGNCIPSLTKVVFYFYQFQFLLNTEGVSMLDTITNKIKHIAIDALSIQPTNHLTRGCPFKGLTPVTKILYRSMFNVYIYFILISIHIFLSLKAKISGTKTSKTFIARLCQGSVTLILLNYAYMGNTSLTLLHCVDVIGQPVLFIDGEVTCLQPWQYIVIAYVILFIAPVTLVLLFGVQHIQSKKIAVKDFMISLVFPLAIPCSYIFCRKEDRKRRESDASSVARANLDTISQSAASYSRQTSASPLYSPVGNYTEDRDETGCGYRFDDDTISMTSATSDRSRIQSDHTGEVNQPIEGRQTSARDAILDVLARPFLKEDGTGPVYWEGVLLLRRFCIIVLSVMIENKVVFLYLSLLLIVLTLIHHHWKQPFRHWIANIAETVSLILLSVLCAMNLFYAHYIMDDQQLNEMAIPIARVFDWITFAIAVAVPLLIILAILIAILFKLFISIYQICTRISERTVKRRSFDN